jgi:hypothetical protein
MYATESSLANQFFRFNVKQMEFTNHYLQIYQSGQTTLGNRETE